MYNKEKCLYLYDIKSNYMSNCLNQNEMHNSIEELENADRAMRIQARRQRAMKVLSVVFRIIIVAAGIALFLSSCKKKSQDEVEARRCWRCSITKTHNTTGGEVTTNGIDSICNKTAAELKVYNDLRLTEYTQSGIMAQISCQ